MALTEYRRKRDFKVTSEPKGGRVAAHKGLSFVIQKHDASHLHYDFRLELDGVLKSWAVPKGPSLDPAQKRLAMHVEDHPLEYGDFEGIIPQGEYGGGTVLLWDQGTWNPIGDARQGFRAGSLKFELHGKKLKGRWMLVRKRGKRGDPQERHWFLFKERDEFAAPDSDIAADEPLSVTTGRDLDAIAKQAKRVWGPGGEVRRNGHAKPTSKLPARNGQSEKKKSKSMSSGRAKKPKFVGRPARAELARELKRIGAKRSAMPRDVSVQLATLTEDVPPGDDWIHEIKFDGYRMLCRVDGQQARFISRNGKDWTSKFTGLGQAATSLPVADAILDGEVVIMQPDGTTSFQALQNAFQNPGAAPLWYFVFDLLYLNGHDLRQAAIEDRKALLERIVSGADGPIRYSDHVVGNGETFFKEAARLHLEGIVSKRLGRPYTGDRSRDWLKIKTSLREEFVIGGFTPPSGARTHFGALLLGYYDADKNLVYAGRVGTGFNDRTLAKLHATLVRLAQKKSAFKNLSGNTGQARGVTWLKPSLVAQIAFSNWTDERQLRHPVFLGLREDKAAQEVVRDVPVPASVIESTQKAAAMSKKKMTLSRNGKPRTAENGNGVASTESKVAGVRLSHPDKVLYPEDNITKLELARYYEQAVDWMLPHVENRLLSLVRCPAGSGQKCFFQKHPGEADTEHFRRFKVVEKRATEEYLALYDLAGLVSLVQMGALEIHLWGSQADQFEKPDRLIFDLDPDPTVDWKQLVTAAKEVRLLLEELELVSFLKTTGGKGLHIVVPVRRRTAWPEAKAFCRSVADFLVAAAPDRYIATMSKAARKGKIFVDYLRNDRGATSIAPYSTRARAGAPVSVPIAWEELSNRITSDHFNIRNLPARLAKLKRDPWAEIFKVNQAITAAMVKKLGIH